MNFKEYVIDLMKKCKNNIEYDPHFYDKCEELGIDPKEVKSKMAKRDILIAFPNPNERKSFKADESHLIQIAHTSKYSYELAAYFYLKKKVLIATIYKILRRGV